MARRVTLSAEALMEVDQWDLSDAESDDDELDLTMDKSIFDDSDLDLWIPTSRAVDPVMKTVTALIAMVGVLKDQMTLTFLIVHLQFKIQKCIFHPN